MIFQILPLLHFTFDILHFTFLSQELFYRGEVSMWSLRRDYYSRDNDFSNPKYHFYILYSIFYILHFTLARIVLPRRSEYVEFTQRLFKLTCNSTKLTATSLFLIFTFLLFISLATKALRHKEPRKLFHVQIDNFPLRGTEGA